MVRNANKRNWFLLRIAILIAAMFQAPSFSNALNGDFSHANWVTFFVLIGFGAIGVLFVISIQAANPLALRQWHRPSWFSSPFAFRQPILMFDFAAYYFLVLGTVSLIFGVTASPKNWAWEIPLSVGIGAWIGVRMCVSVFRERLIDDE